MISHFSNEKTNDFQEEELHFNYKRKKILMYLFNSEYKNYLKIMTTFEINRKKFRNLKQFDDDDSYKKIKNNFNNIENICHFLHLIIYNGLSFIFLYIPDILTINYIRNKDYYDIKKELSKNKEESEKTNKELEKTRGELFTTNKEFEKTRGEFINYKKESSMRINELMMEINKLKARLDSQENPKNANNNNGA